MPPHIPRSTHNPNQPRSSKPTQTKTKPHHKLRLNHHRGLPTSLPSIINSNPHRYHRDHATRHAWPTAPISPHCGSQCRSRHAVTHRADLATAPISPRWWHALNERERERCERGRENWGWKDGVGFFERKRERTAPERVGVRVRWRGERKKLLKN